ncbi:carbonic anhydrase [Actinoplanes tereljensis]|uniref:Carbonic anhydrase n=1 Tax=Paractinoplanes tereljensis TaxID=571912 RepID=A0A919NPT3_9ACTN|nr:carbonic anhydrase [Actinoplanes tereljensis]GIF21432.1 carbonic anhydrase [Actinoplanes tereljensis]
MTSTNWARLSEGNIRWVEGRSRADGQRGAVRRAELTTSQNPFALVLGCADSRVPAEILFDQGLGDLFVVRTAGQTVDSAVLGSMEYAVEVLGVELLVVLGHEGCGAVAAAARVIDEVAVPHGYIRDVAEKIAPNVLRARLAGASTPEEVGAQHAAYTLELLRERSSALDNAIRRGALGAVATQYSLKTGRVCEVAPLSEPHLLAA